MLPLNDVRVIEFCQIAAGPFCGMLLADFGADATVSYTADMKFTSKLSSPQLINHLTAMKY